MFARAALLVSIIQAALLFGRVEARTWILERDGRAIYARRFGQAQPDVLMEIAAACGGGICDALADEAIAPLLAVQPECSQQDMADKIIDASRQFDTITQSKMIAAAVKYRQTEKNTPPESSTNPPTLLNSVYCQKAPKNNQLNGLVQAQDTANDPNLFFDPATGTTITRGSQPNTVPFDTNAPLLVDQVRLAARSMMDGTNSTTNDGKGGKVLGANNKNNGTKTNGGKGNDKNNGGDKKNGDKKHKNGGKKNGNTKSGDNKNGDNKTNGNLKTNSGGNMGNGNLLNPMKDGNNKTTDGTKSNIVSNMGGNNGTDKHHGMHGKNGTKMANGKNGTNLTNGKNGTDMTNGKNGTNTTNGNNGTNNAGNIGNFGSCSVPEIQFGAGFDGRRETSFEPVDKVSYNHGSAQNIDIITQFMCDQLVNTCKADATAKATCAKAKTAADGAPAKTGKQADAFNAVFGKTTNFANVTPLDDQGNPIAARSLHRGLLRILRRTEGYLGA